MKLNCFVALLCAGIGYGAMARDFAVETILRDLPVHPEGDQNVFATSFDYREGMLFVANVEPGEDKSGKSGLNLRTVVRKGVRQPDATWAWSSTVIEPRTLLDAYHTQASIALDKLGYVHVAYNMHNMPWQYVVSKKPFDISEFEFRGQSVTQAELEAVKLENKTPFPGIGSAAIAGNQITYPMFFADRNRELYLTYRYALKPARDWKDRAFAGAIARYDVESRRWAQIGGPVGISAADALIPGKTATQTPFAFEDGYSVYLITLGFDRENGMHVFWNWRPEGAGMETIKPGYAYSPDGREFFGLDGKLYELPVSWKATTPVAGISDQRQYYAPKSVAVPVEGSGAVILHPLLGGREIWTLDRKQGVFKPEKSPESAPVLLVDRVGRQWAIATGLKVFMREQGSPLWVLQGEIGKNLCAPKARYYAEESRFVVHAKACDSQAASFFTFRR